MRIAFHILVVWHHPFVVNRHTAQNMGWNRDVSVRDVMSIWYGLIANEYLEEAVAHVGTDAFVSKLAFTVREP